MEFAEVIGEPSPQDQAQASKVGLGIYVARDVPVAFAPGVLSAPTKGDRLVIGDLADNPNYPVAFAGSSSVFVELDAGERVIFSQWREDDDPEKPLEVRSTIRVGRDLVEIATKAGRKIVIKDSGEVEIVGAEIKLNGDSKRLVTFSELNSALQGLVSSINIALGGKKDEPGAIGTLSLDLSSAETSTIKTGG